jgi:basic membrane protein A
MKKKARIRTLIVLAAAFALVVAACGDDDDTGDTTTTAAETTTTAAAETTTTAAGETTTTAAATTTAAPDFGVADFNGDGVVVIGVATDGPRDDGAYYQALVEQVEEISEVAGYEDPIIVDKIDPANSRAELENLAAQNVDIIAIGSGALADGNEDLYLQYEDIFWYCNCGSGLPETPGVLMSQDSGAELQLSSGYATGLLLQESGGDSAVFIGCCDLDFEKESFMAFQLGLATIDESYTATYVPTGNFPFDFNNTAGATEAYENAVAEGADAVLPFLGGAHEPIVALANEDGLIVMTAGSSRGCSRSDLAYDMNVKFDSGDYLVPVFEEILSGTAEEGTIRRFTVGVDPEVGAEFCDATPEQIAALDEFNLRIGAGEFDEQIFEILSEAYGF